jgi:MoaA/NifB/PqqE/SkfB family radical SAM enzyme
MDFSYQDIRVLQAEISSDCNAACPQCPRNIYGGKTIPNLPIKRWTFEDLPKMFRNNFVAQLDLIYFCGTYGDPMMNPQVYQIADWFKQRNSSIKIGIHTNGGVGKLQTYKNLAGLVDFMSFGIDGLDDTNHLYRRRVKWNQVMDRAETFISAGGKAIWDFIVFEHNQHQVEKARTVAGTLGFSEFNVKKTSRFLNRKHEVMDFQPVLDKNGNEEYRIYPPSDTRYLNKQLQMPLGQELLSTEISCNAHRINEIYVAADGMVFPCGWLHDRLYGPEVESTSDHMMMKKMLSKIGGSLNANCNYVDLEEIVDGQWFKMISNSWGGRHRLQRCAVMCGACINPIGEQNEDINYKD